MRIPAGKGARPMANNAKEPLFHIAQRDSIEWWKAWLIRIARNLICDTHRRKAPIVDIADEKERARVMENPTMAVGSIEDDLHNAQTVSDLTSMITYLPEPQQEVVRMRIFENRSFKEIAQLTNCSINTALGRMRYAVINLRRMAATRDLTLVEYD